MIHARAVGFFCLFVLIEVDIDYLCSCRCLVFKLIFFLGLFFFLRQTPRSVTETLHAVSGPKSLPQAFVWKEKAKMQTTSCLGDSLKVSFQTRGFLSHFPYSCSCWLLSQGSSFCLRHRSPVAHWWLCGTGWAAARICITLVCRSREILTEHGLRCVQGWGQAACGVKPSMSSEANSPNIGPVKILAKRESCYKWQKRNRNPKAVF